MYSLCLGETESNMILTDLFRAVGWFIYAALCVACILGIAVAVLLFGDDCDWEE